MVVSAIASTPQNSLWMRETKSWSSGLYVLMTKGIRKSPAADSFDDAVECCADLNIPFFVDAGNKKLVFWFVRVDDEGYPEIARCTEREFATILSGISAGGMYCPECGTVHWPDGVAPPF
ncbi:IS91, orf2 [Shigella sonnei]|nr:IS91, orf2 [Shigella sonnei]